MQILYILSVELLNKNIKIINYFAFRRHKLIHANIKNKPPSGVIGPKKLKKSLAYKCFVLKIYNDPEKQTMPDKKR